MVSTLANKIINVYSKYYLLCVIFIRMDATLREITNLIKEVNPEANERGTTFDFQLIIPDRFSARYLSREIGTTCCGQKGLDDEKTLNQCK